MLWTVLVIVALLIIVALGFYAGRLLFQLKQQNQRQQKVRDERIKTISESIYTIAKAMEQQQCDLSEGVIRIVNLLGALPILSPPDHKASYPHTYALFVEVSGFAVLEDRQKLSKQEKRKQDIAREQIESDYESKVLSEMPAIKAYCQSIT
ncbi:DUF2489 domain-containing protein [Alteromonas sp. KS69]|jgi:hypothetical protein|uniref:DUF2489 domain-containing protein n=1 Tax=unclassified Alteromonas TaxID=2614992 RepID=UPI000F85E83A|nr:MULTISPECIES: DUF2489 domain-containing protein [unclassified Alteromonas]MBO7921406.1 DUF2489 domain-containing protein [Alteromonas sp. K632G]RUP83665.1 DUF2489 domain-containing protein [Alteromonas sp. KS69]